MITFKMILKRFKRIICKASCLVFCKCKCGVKTDHFDKEN